jgi:hypothetical protein
MEMIAVIRISETKANAITKMAFKFFIFEVFKKTTGPKAGHRKQAKKCSAF